MSDAAGKPIPGADVAFYSEARPRSGGACEVVYTDKDGNWAYRFPPGEVYVYIRERVAGGHWSKNDYTLQLSQGQTIDDIDFKLSIESPRVLSEATP